VAVLLLQSTLNVHITTKGLPLLQSVGLMRRCVLHQKNQIHLCGFSALNRTESHTPAKTKLVEFCSQSLPIRHA